jgi:hypothetical protein
MLEIQSRLFQVMYSLRLTIEYRVALIQVNHTGKSLLAYMFCAH